MLSNLFSIVLDYMSIKLTVVSDDPLAKYFPSGENATVFISSTYIDFKN